VFTDPLASPTGFPFKVAVMADTLSEDSTYKARKRVCDLGYLRQPYRREDGTVGYRCASEPIENYLKKGGKVEATEGRKCLCNGLMATIGLGQVRHGITEPPIVTAGNEVVEVARLLGDEQDSYSAADVMRYLLGESSPAPVRETEHANLA
jgi:nitronate monooxygenase